MVYADVHSIAFRNFETIILFAGNMLTRNAMESKSVLGTSLQVPSVKDIISNKEELITAIPPRYVRHDQDPCFVIDMNLSSKIPVIDMAKLFSQEFMDSELKKLDHACKDWGFFQLVNHGVSTELLDKVKSKTEEFFNLPKEEKHKFCQKPGELEGFGQHFVKTEEQKLEWADLFYVVTQPTHLKNLHLFSNFPQSFRDAIDTYSEEVKKLANEIFDLVVKALGMKPNEMEELFEQGWQAMRMNCYPPCPQPDRVIGLKPHSDATGLTILLQLNDVVGLQIKKDGLWIPVQPLPNAFIINIGDMLEILSNGIYRSIEHRATISSTEERLSIATFHNPKFDGYIAPAPSLITTETPAAFDKISFADYFQGYVSRELDGKSFIEVLRIQNDQVN